MTLLEAINKAAQLLSERGICNARLDAETLLVHCIGKSRVWLITHITDELDDGNRGVFEEVVARRARREPLQYILGNQEFWGLDFIVTPDVLIPRPETEHLIESVLGMTRGKDEPRAIVDLCTGSGCIAVSLAKELPAARLFATDRSAKALAIARENARRQGVADRIRFCEGDLFEPLEELDILGQIDIIVSNPPYIPSGVLSSLQAEVRDYEPETALIAGPDGTEMHQRILVAAPRFLVKQGALIMEMGFGQAESLAAMLRNNAQYESHHILKDLAGIQRVIVALKQ